MMKQPDGLREILSRSNIPVGDTLRICAYINHLEGYIEGQKIGIDWLKERDGLKPTGTVIQIKHCNNCNAQKGDVCGLTHKNLEWGDSADDKGLPTNCPLKRGLVTLEIANEH